MLSKSLFCLVLLLAQAGGVIRGQILIPSTRASERIQVILQRADGPIVSRVFSDSLGNFEFRGVPAGSYEILVSVEGYEDVRQSVGVAGGGLLGTVTVNIPLTEKGSIVKAPGGSAGPEASIVDIAELSRKYPRRAVQDYERALEENRKGNSGTAAELLAGVVKLAPDFYAARNTLGAIYQKMNRYREAETEYVKARELNPRSAEPLVNLGSLYIQETDARTQEGEEVAGKILDSALDTLEEALKIRRTALTYYLLGTAYYKSTFYEEAETNLKHALDFDSHPPTTQLALANLYIKQQNWGSALAHLDAYLIENPKEAGRAEIRETRAKVAQRVK